MQPRTLQQIQSELNSTYDPQVQSLNAQKALIPGQIAAEEKGLEAKQTQSFNDILGGARRRGLGFAGIPLAEQANYTATEFLPAMARLRQTGKQQEMSLQDAILGILERRDSQAQSIYQTEQDRAFQASEAEKSRQAAAFSPSFGTGTTGTETASQSTRPKINRDASGGYQFTDAYGSPVTAAEYVQLAQLQGMNIGYRQLLSQMASTGDKNAAIALQFVGNDAKFGNAPTQYQAALSALGATGSYMKDSQRNITNTPVSRGTTVNTNINVPNYGYTRTK